MATWSERGTNGRYTCGVSRAPRSSPAKEDASAVARAASSALSKLSVTARKRCSISAVSSAASAPDRVATNASTSIGSPTCANTRVRGASLRSKVSPIGTIRTPVSPDSLAWSAMRAAPVLSGASVGWSPLIPSGKIRMARPRFSAPFNASKDFVLRCGSTGCPAMSLARMSGTTPTARNTAASSGFANSVAFAVIATRRGTIQATTSASTSAFGWFTASSTGASAGMRSSPSTSMRE